jgi:hypothetical protein
MRCLTSDTDFINLEAVECKIGTNRMFLQVEEANVLAMTAMSRDWEHVQGSEQSIYLKSTGVTAICLLLIYKF